MQPLRKLKVSSEAEHIWLPYDPGITRLDIHRTEICVSVHQNTSARMLVAGLFLIAENWKPIQIPKKSRLNKYTWYTHTFESVWHQE